MRKLVITIPIDDHDEALQTLYAIGVKLKSSGNQIFTDCVNGCLPEALTEIDRGFSVEVTANEPEAWVEPEFDLQNHIKKLDSGRPQPDLLIVSESAARKLSEVTLGYIQQAQDAQGYIAPSFAPKEDSGFEIPTFEVMG